MRQITGSPGISVTVENYISIVYDTHCLMQALAATKPFIYLFDSKYTTVRL